MFNKICLSAFVALFFVFPLSPAAFAGDLSIRNKAHYFTKGVKAFRTGKYMEAKTHLTRAAKLSDDASWSDIKYTGAAQYNLGYMYARGLGVPKDLITAFAFFKVSSDVGEYKASVALASIMRHMSREELGIAVKRADRLVQENNGEKSAKFSGRKAPHPAKGRRAS